MNSDSALKARRGCSPFTLRELETFKGIILQERAEALKDFGGLSEAARRTAGDAVGGGSSVPGHIAELASETFDQELSLGFMGRAGEELQELQDALERIENRSYGLCEDCAQAIPKVRLEAIPTARFCIDCKSRIEEQK